MAFGVAVVCGSSAAMADVSSWVYVGGGAADLQLSSAKAGSAVNPFTLQLDAGFGTAPTNPLVVGFAAKTLTFVDYGTDIGLALRLTTPGYSLGTWGVALDLGGTQRFWGQTTSLATTSLTFGLPWGVNLAATAGSDFGDNQSLVLTLGIDWARLTVHRTAGDGWWRNYRLPVADRDLARR